MPVSANIKLALVIIASAIVVSILLYTQSIVEKLQAREKQIANLYVNSLKYFGTRDELISDLTFLTDQIVSTIDFPIVLTSPYDELISEKNLDMKRGLPKQDSIRFIYARIEEMKKINPPLAIKYNDSIVVNYFYYDESTLVKELRWLPYIEIIVAGMFIFIGYIGFSYIRRSEQSNVWVGMSRETAHQLGTPLSSIMGWIELMKSQTHDPNLLTQTLHEMQNDVERLNKIAMRFSKIGSRPDLKDEDLTAISSRVIEYYKRRIPQSGKKVELSLLNDQSIHAKVNAELFEWVLENLIKNALDAMENGLGKIQITVAQSGRYILLDVVDNGKGIDKRFKKDVFRPGFSTKKRGWGLGLSLSKRIIDNYHRGKLFILDSAVGKGTTFRIKLKK